MSNKRLFGLFRSKSIKSDSILTNLGSGTTLLTSSHDPYSPPPNLQQQKRSRSKSVGRESSTSTPSPPPLPTLRKFASVHDLRKKVVITQESIMQHLPKAEYDDDNIPLGYLQLPTIIKHSSLLSDKEEEDDKDLIPIAAVTQTLECQSAADKYKERVKEKLNMDDDNIPLLLL